MLFEACVWGTQTLNFVWIEVHIYQYVFVVSTDVMFDFLCPYLCCSEHL